MGTKSAIVAANSLLQSAESALPKQKKVLVVTEFNHAMVACKRHSKAQKGEEVPGLVQLPQDVLILYLQFLGFTFFASAATVCRSWSVAAKENHLWETLYVDFFSESDRCSRIDSFRSSRTIEYEEKMHSESDVVNGISINWREALKTVYRRLSSKKFTRYRGYCRHYNLIVWLDNTKCYNRHSGKSCKSPNIGPVSMHEIIDYVLYDCPPSDSSSDSDSDSYYAAISKLWNYFSN